MYQETKKTNLEKKAQVYTGDGIIDVMLGMAVILAGISMFLNLTTFAAIWIVLLIPITRSIKRYVTVPRIDQVDFEPLPNAKKRRLFIYLVLLGTLAFVIVAGLFFFAGRDSIPVGISRVLGAQPPIYAITMVLVFVLLCLILIARGFGVRHFLAYAGLIIIFIISSIWIDLELPYYMILFGTIALSYGIVALIRFILRYPKMNHATQA
jgi:hypothetical protein